MTFETIETSIAELLSRLHHALKLSSTILEPCFHLEEIPKTKIK